MNGRLGKLMRLLRGTVLALWRRVCRLAERSVNNGTVGTGVSCHVLPAKCDKKPRPHLSCYLQNALLAPVKACQGQSTIEYLVVGAALIIIIAALGVFSGRLQEGLFVQHAADSASHAITTNTAGSAGDILLY